MTNKNYFLSGITDLLILFLLSKGDKYVYEINQMISRLSSGLLNLSQNTSYTSTYRLENDGMITEYSKLVGRKRTRVYYHLENEGRDYLEELMETYKVTIDGINLILKQNDEVLSSKKNE